MGKLTHDDLSKLQISESTRRINPGLFAPDAVAGLGATLHRKPKRTLERKAPKKRRGKGGAEKGPGYCVTLIGFIRRRMDDDNLAHSFKPLRDAIADHLGIDDGDNRLRWEYGQVETRGRQGASVKVERM